MTTSPHTQRTRHPLSIGQTVLHLALLGTAGWGVIGGLFGMLGAGIGLTFVLGIGLFVLAGLVYALFGLAWFETARVNGLYKLNALPPTFARLPAATFGGWIRAVGKQLGNGPMWRSLGNFVLACTLGTVLAVSLQGFFWSVATLARPNAILGSNLYGWSTPFVELTSTQFRLIGAGGIVLSLATIIGMALLHRLLSIAIVGSQSREAALAAEAQRAAADAQRAGAEARESAAQREGAVRSADVERTRIERDLHDGVQPRLVSVGMTLGLAQQTIDSDPAAAKALIEEAHTSTKAAITELRQLARGIHASVLDDRGLDAALSALAGRSHIPVVLDVRMEGRVARAAESAVYFVIAECLTNAAKHSRASECRVTVRVRSTPTKTTDGSATAATETLWARVEDNGIGGAEMQPGGGLDGISNRVRAAGGTISIDSPAGGPTAVEVSVPCAS